MMKRSDLGVWLCPLVVAVAAAARAEDKALPARVNVPGEVVLTAAQPYQDIFNDVEVAVTFRGPDGVEWEVPAFWTGKSEFRARFAAPQPGRFTWRSDATNSRDTGLHGCTGQWEVQPYDGPNPLYRHGRLRVAATRRTLEHADGTPFLWLGDTWWNGFTSRLDWPKGMSHLTADRVAKGFNVIQIVAGPLPDFNANVDAEVWHPLQRNEGGWPWEKGWTRINPAFYDHADVKVKHLVENGLTPCMVGMWGYYLPTMGVQRVQKHWRYLVARYGAYPVVWCLAGELDMPAYNAGADAARQRSIQTDGWTAVGRYVRQLDPFQNVICAHPTGISRGLLHDESILDMNMLQTGHGGYGSLKHTVASITACNAKQPRIPVLNGEVCYEGILGGSWQDVQRFLFYTSILCGSAGHTYGAQGIWGMNTRSQPYVGVTGSWGDGYWQDAMHYPGSTQMGIGRRFFERYPWRLFEPRSEPRLPSERIAAFAAGIPATVAIFYFPASTVPQELRGMRGAPIQIERGASYRAYYVSPRTGEDVHSWIGHGLRLFELDKVVPAADGFWTPPPQPSMGEDWLLVLEDRAALE